MTIEKDKLFGALARFSKTRIASAGARYTPGVDVNAPNIVNEPLFRALHHLSCGIEVQDELTNFGKELAKRWERSRDACEKLETIGASIGKIQELLRDATPRLRDGDESLFTELVTKLKETSQQLATESSRLHKLEAQALESARERAKQEGRETGGHSSEANSIREKLNDIYRSSSFLTEALEIYDSATGQLLVRRLALLRGQWGTGKFVRKQADYLPHWAAGLYSLRIKVLSFLRPASQYGFLCTGSRSVRCGPTGSGEDPSWN